MKFTCRCLDFLDHQILLSLLNRRKSEIGYIQNFQCFLHYLLSCVYVKQKESTDFKFLRRKNNLTQRQLC